MNSLVRARSFAAFALALSAPSPLRAQAVAGLPVTPAAPQTPAAGEEIVVKGDRRRPTDATAAATVVDARRFAGEAKTVAELVTTAPGVAVNDYGGLGQLTTVSLRGSSADQVQVFLDGLPLNSAAGGGVDLSRIPRAWIDRIEIVRGAAGATYGPGAMGGAVDVVTRRAPAGSASGAVTFGSFGTFSGAADGALGGEHWGLSAAGSFDRTGGDFGYLLDKSPSLPESGSEALTRLHDVSYSVGGLAKLWADVGRGRLDAALQAAGGARDLPGTAYHFTPSDGQDDARLGLAAQLSRPLASGLDLELGLTAREDHLDVRIAPTPQVRQRDHATDLSARLLWTAGPSALSLRLSAGAEQLDVQGASGHGWGAFSLAAADELALAGGRLTVAPGVRYDRQGPFDGLSGRLGAVGRLTDILRLRGSVGRAFRIPSFGELYLQQGSLLPNPALVPESSWSADAALVAEGRLGLASVGAFAQLYRDLVVWEAVWQGRASPINDGKASARGLEVELASAPFGRAALLASAAYTWLATETLRGDDLILGKELPHRAPQRLFARLSAAPGPVELHGEAHFVAAQWGDRENSAALRVPAALTFNAGAGVRLRRAPEVNLSLEVKNLFDDRSLQDGFGYPLPGRTVLLTLRAGG